MMEAVQQGIHPIQLGYDIDPALALSDAELRARARVALRVPCAVVHGFLPLRYLVPNDYQSIHNLHP